MFSMAHWHTVFNGTMAHCFQWHNGTLVLCSMAHCFQWHNGTLFSMAQWHTVFNGTMAHCFQWLNCTLFSMAQWHQGRSQDFLKGRSSTSIELLEAGVWGRSPQLQRDFQYFNKSKLSKLLYFMQKVHYLFILFLLV